MKSTAYMFRPLMYPCFVNLSEDDNMSGRSMWRVCYAYNIFLRAFVDFATIFNLEFYVLPSYLLF
jgi:hypothetical protein